MSGKSLNRYNPVHGEDPGPGEKANQNNNGVNQSRNEETTILSLLRKGEPEGIEWMMERYHAKLYPLAYGICKNHEDVEEVLQDVYMLAMTKIDLFQERSRFYTWIYRITVNAALMKRRQSQRRSLAVSIEKDEILSGWNDGFAGTAVLNANPEQMVSAKQLQERLSGGVFELPEKYHEVFALRARGCSIKEISRILHMTPAAVKSRMHRGRSYLRQILDGEMFKN